MLKELELENMVNQIIYLDGIYGEFVNKITRWLDRKFAPNGDGCPWPAGDKWDGTDQTTVEMWFQAEHYLQRVMPNC